MPPTHQESVRLTKILNNIIDALLRERNKMSHESECTISHLDGLNWEVLVVFLTNMSVGCFPNGKIVLSWDLIRHFPSDAEKATIIAHEVARVVARHFVEQVTKNLCDLVWLFSVLHLLCSNGPFCHSMFEFEADYIGLLLMAAAGYDPRVAPKVYEELGKLSGHNNDFMFTGFLSTHSSGRQRAKALAQPKIMEEALILYNDARARSEVN
ncbi:putative peptidase M48 [Medicago truncatula]|nr:putative peptidase M48 [Medicago truncatula]